jgi:hypothetical protein
MKLDVRAGNKPGDVNFTLIDSRLNAGTAATPVLKYAPKALSGEWARVVMPLSDMMTAEAKFDPQKAWQLKLDLFAQGSNDFSIYIDDIAFETRK